MNVRLDIKGLAPLDAKLKTLDQRVVRNVSGRALRAKARPIVDRAKQLVPVRTGALKKSITTQLRRVQEGSRTIEIGFRPPTSRRAHLVEFGTAHSAAQPFMRPALDEMGEQAIREMGRVLGEGIEREAKG